MRGLLAVAVWLALALPAMAHVTELAVLRLSEISPGRFTMSWELRPNTDIARSLEPTFPAQCAREDMVVDCGKDGLVGPLSFELIGQGQSAAMFKIRYLDGSTRVYTVTPADPVADVSASFDARSWAGIAEIAGSYLLIGFEHILKGIDHLLFVLGLIWIARARWMLLKTITAFTVAHSVTLGAATFGLVGVPESFVNAMIALSIVFVGVEVMHARAGRLTLTQAHPWLVAFGFGLLHGFGFANALIALGLPEDAIPVALVSFNVGVELGQIAFVLVVLALAWSYRVMQVRWPGWAAAVPAYTIGGLGAFWFYERSAVLIGG